VESSRGRRDFILQYYAGNCLGCWSNNYFFFRAEDGIRGGHVTGVQTCALPISTCPPATPALRAGRAAGRKRAAAASRRIIPPCDRPSTGEGRPARPGGLG